MSLPAALRSGAMELAQRLGPCGFQFHIIHSGAVIADAALGYTIGGLELTPRHLHKVWCATKPILAFLATDIAEIPPQTVVIRDEPSATLQSILDHRAGILSPSLYEILVTPTASRTQAKETISPEQGWDASSDAGYSSYAAWEVLVSWIEERSKQPVSSLIDAVLRAANASDEIFVSIDRSTYRRIHDRIGVYLTVRQGGRWPLPWLHDRTFFSCSVNTSPALGGYASARGLARWYAFISRNGAPRQRDAPSPFDRTLKRCCAFSDGHMVRLHEHEFGDAPSARAFGMSGWGGNSFAIADPDHDLVFAMITNRSFVEGEAARWKQEAVSMVYDVITR
jgi:CubicO group peptidase (beta-lactamase class C family)